MRHEGSYGRFGLGIIKENNELEVVRQILYVRFFQPLMIFEATVLDDRSVVQVGHILGSYHPLEGPALTV
jgi:hypothetical protein